jgi:hypothetical protein
VLATAGALFPVLLASTVSAAYDLDAAHASSGGRSLTLGIGWWSAALALAVLYTVNVYRTARGKVKLGASGH